MLTKKFSITLPERDIPCKVFLPEGDPELVVLGVHGFAGDKDSSVLKRLAQALCENRGALVCFDFPAHGESRAEDSQLRVETCMEDFLAAADYVRGTFPGKRYGVFATSFGGYITLQCAEKIPDFQLVLRAPAVTMAETFISTIIPCGKEEFLEQGGAWCGFERKMFVSRAYYQDLLDNPPRIPHVPLLILHGTADDVIPFEAVRAIAESNPNVKLVPFEGADHRFKRKGEIERIVEAAMGWYTGTSSCNLLKNGE